MSLFIKTETFRKIGGFPPELLIYCDEIDLSWSVWISGGKIVTVPAARLHHRGAATVNPHGNTKVVESRTSDLKRYLSNRNGLLLLMKNSQHFFLLLLVPNLLLLFVEAIFMLLVIRRWEFIRKSYIDAVIDAFTMKDYVRTWRKRVRGYRQRGDLEMLRFLRLKPNRWGELTRMFKFGPPKVSAN